MPVFGTMSHAAPVGHGQHRHSMGLGRVVSIHMSTQSLALTHVSDTGDHSPPLSAFWLNCLTRTKRVKYQSDDLFETRVFDLGNDGKDTFNTSDMDDLSTW